MKKLYSVFKQTTIVFCFILSGKALSQTYIIPYQFYLDANNNCVYDAGESYLYNLPCSLGITYTNTTGSSVYGYTPSAGCGAPLSVSNPSIPATNFLTCTVNANSYPTFSMNASCPSLTNISYTATNYFPVKSINQMSDVTYYSWGTGSHNGKATNNIFPVCYNLGSDSVSFYFDFNNLYTCSSNTATRTYSIYFDGTLIDQVTTTGVNTANFLSGTKSTLLEYYWDTGAQIYLRSQLSSGPLSLGLHTFSIKTTNMYASPLSSLNYSCTLNSVPCNKVSGVIYNDCNNNCVLDGGDGNIFTGMEGKIYQNIGGYSLSFYPSSTGAFSCYLPASPNPYYLTTYSTVTTVTSCPSTTVNIPSGTGSITSDFGFKANSFFDAIASVHGKYTPAVVPGGTFYPYFSVGNWMASTCSSSAIANPGKAKLLLDKNFTYQSPVAPTPAPDFIIPGPNGDTVVWNVADFNTSAFYSIQVGVSTTASVGAQFYLKGIISPQVDSDTSNNTANDWGTIGGPFDPNNKTCYSQGIQANGDIPFGNQDLYYTVNFQNVGTAPAINVLTIDTLDSNLDWNALKVLASSFPVQLQVDKGSGQVIYSFKNINLPDSTTNEKGSHGYVRYRIKLKSGVPVNTIFKNRAYNYFDFQPPVPTNQTKNKLVNMVGIKELELSNSIKLQPNPVSDKLFIFCDEQIKEIVMLNSLGQPISKQEMNAKQSVIEMSNLPAGFYFVNIKTQSGRVLTKKIIKD
jgi:uncharacterized repeat protein (TIGR01451 family)